MKLLLALFDTAMSKLSNDIKNSISVRCAIMTLYVWTVTYTVCTVCTVCNVCTVCIVHTVCTVCRVSPKGGYQGAPHFILCSVTTIFCWNKDLKYYCVKS